MGWQRRFLNLFRSRRLDRDLERELSFHILERSDDLAASGMSPIDASREARRRFGNFGLQKERTRDMNMFVRLEALAADLRFGLRGLLRNPGYLGIALITLMAALGLNASVFTVMEALYIRPWQVPDPASVFAAFWRNPEGVHTLTRYSDFEFLQREAKRAELTAFAGVLFTLRPAPDAQDQSVRGFVVDETFFDVTRVPLQRGTGFSGLSPGHGNVVVISSRLWQRTFDGDPEIIGRVVYLGEAPATITGVVAAGYDGVLDDARDLYTLIPSRASWDYTWRSWGRTPPNPQAYSVDLLGRVRPEWTRAEAQVELNGLLRNAGLVSTGAELVLTGTAPGQLPGLRSDLPVLLALVLGGCLLVLLLACANLGNLQLARGVVRAREIATRLALGASRARIVIQLLTENLILALLAGAGGVAVAWFVPELITRFSPEAERMPSGFFTPNFTVLGFALLLSFIAAAAFGLGPALHITRRSAPTNMQLRGFAGDRSLRRARGVLLAAQITVSTVLLVSALLLTRGVVNAGGNLGYSLANLSMGSIFGVEGRFAALRDAIEDAGFDAAYSQFALGEALNLRLAVTARGSAPRPFAGHAVSANYFRVLGVPLISGRMFEDEPERREVVLNEAGLRALPSGIGPGSEILIDGEANRIVGIVNDAAVTDFGPARPTLFHALDAESARLRMTIFARNLDAAGRNRLMAIAAQIDSRLRQFPLTPAETWISEQTRNTIAGASIASGIGLVALALACIGVFGLFGYLVEERRRELGIRMAIGAIRTEIVRAALDPAGRAMLAGLGAGLVLAAGVGIMLQSYLFGLSPLDPLSYLIVIFVLAFAGALATYIPARRAARVDPIAALRHE